MALGIGYGLPFLAQHGANPYKTQWAAAREGAKGAGATVEDENAGTGSCLVARGQDVYTDGLPSTPSLLIVPQFYKEGNLYQDVPPFVAEDTTMRFTVSRNTTATRVNSSGLIASVASGVPRIDWLGQSCPALLVEASGQNLALQSTFSTGWNTSLSGSVSGNASGTNSPEGSGNAALLSVVATAFSSISRTITTVSGSVYTASVFAKKRDKDFLYFVNLAGSTAVAWFNLASGTVGTVGANTTARIENYGNGWYRCSITQTVGGTTSYIQFGLSDANNTNAAASSGSNFVFGAQFELGSVPTSYIPTTTTTASRAADVISASGALVSGLIGQTEGTIYAEVDVRALGAAKNIMQIDEGASTNRIGLFVDISPTRLTLLMSNGGVTNSISGSVTTGITKIAASYSSGNVQVFTNGSFLVSGTIASYPTATLNSISVGSRISFGVYGIQLNDRIRAAALYTTRLSNDQLAELTRL